MPLDFIEILFQVIHYNNYNIQQTILIGDKLIIMLVLGFDTMSQVPKLSFD